MHTRGSLSASTTSEHVHAHAWPTWIDGLVCVNVQKFVLACLCISIHFCMGSYVRFFSLFCCVRVFCNFAKILLFHVFVCLLVWVCVCFLLFFSFVRFSLFGFCFTSCFYFSAGKFCCTRAMLFYCFLPQGHWFFFTLILLFLFVNVHYLEDCTLRESVCNLHPPRWIPGVC